MKYLLLFNLSCHNIRQGFRYTHQFAKNIFLVVRSQSLRNRMIVRFLCFFLRSMVWLLRRLSTVLPCFCAVCVLHIFPDIADIVSTYSFCEFGVAPSAFCPDPHLDPHAEINGNGWLLPGRKFQPFFSFAPHSHDLVHEISHLFCGLFLFLAGGVGVGSQRETGVVVAQHTADGFYVYTIL